MRMKYWFAALVSVAAAGLAAQQASAWFCRPCCCGGKCGTWLCCRPYNAFSPVCFGSLCCDGCCPVQTASFLPGPAFGGGMPWGGCGGPGFGGPGFGGPAFSGPGYGAGGFGAPYVTSPEPDRGAPPGFTPPPPAAAPPLLSSWNHAYNPAPFGVQPANYPPGYYPGYWPAYPMGYWTNAYAPPQHGAYAVPNGR